MTGVIVSPATHIVEPTDFVGGIVVVEFSAVVNGTGEPDQGVTWALEGVWDGPPGTLVSSFDQTGTLTIREEDPALIALTFTAVSTADPSKSGYAEITFAGRGFADIWLVGDIVDAWALPGTPLTKNGSDYSWTGPVAANKEFKFSFKDTTGEFTGTDQWTNGEWLTPDPDGIGTPVTVDTPMDVKTISGDSGDNKWKIGTAGYYTISLNPQTLKLTVTKPPLVESVTLSGGATSVIKGASTTFSATPVGKNLENLTAGQQGVEWTIKESHHADTTLVDGLLHIDAAEGASSLTIYATSRFGAIKSEEKTVAILSASTPSVTGITVSATGDVTEIGLGTTLVFTATVTANNGASEAVTWTVTGKDADGNDVAVVSGTGIAGSGTDNKTGTLTIAAGETAVDLVVTAASTYTGFTDVKDSKQVFVRKLGNVYVVGTDFTGGWVTDQGDALTYTARGVYTMSVNIKKGNDFKFRDDTTVAENWNSGYWFTAKVQDQDPAGEIDVDSQVGAGNNNSWKAAAGGGYTISLDTVNLKVTFSRTPQVIAITNTVAGLECSGTNTFGANVTGVAGTVTWSVTGQTSGNTTIGANSGLLTIGADEAIGNDGTIKTLTVTASDLDIATTTVVVIDTHIYIVGAPNGWATPDGNAGASELSRTGAIFTWEGHLNTDDEFRFTPDGPGVSGWARIWFSTPEWGNTYWINVGSDNAMYRYSSQSVNHNWRFTGASGDYIITLNAATRKFSIAAKN